MQHKVQNSNVPVRSHIQSVDDSEVSPSDLKFHISFRFTQQVQVDSIKNNTCHA